MIQAMAIISCSAWLLMPAHSMHEEQTDPSQSRARSELLKALASRVISEKALLESVRKLGVQADEPPGYWSRIANDPRYRLFHRRLAVMQLFKRHVRVGMPLTDLARLLDYPTWLRATDVTLIDTVKGKLPVHLRLGDTVFALPVLPVGNRGTTVIYLRVTGNVAPAGLVRLLLTGSDAAAEGSTIAEIGIWQVSTRVRSSDLSGDSSWRCCEDLTGTWPSGKIRKGRRERRFPAHLVTAGSAVGT